jgi:hypothetical protein
MARGPNSPVNDMINKKLQNPLRQENLFFLWHFILKSANDANKQVWDINLNFGFIQNGKFKINFKYLLKYFFLKCIKFKSPAKDMKFYLHVNCVLLFLFLRLNY